MGMKIKNIKGMASRRNVMVVAGCAVLSGFAVYGVQQAWLAGVSKFNHEAVGYVMRNNLIQKEDGKTLVRTVEVPVIVKSESDKQVEASIKSNLR